MAGIIEKISLLLLERNLSSITKEIDNIIIYILPHTGEFKKEVKLLSKKEQIFKKIDKLVEKYDKLIDKLEQKDEI